MRNKLKDEFRPIKILELDAWYVLFCKIACENGVASIEPGIINGAFKYAKKGDEEYRVYKGSIPVSLDSRKMFELCEEIGDNDRMVPFQVQGGALNCSNAIINMSFLSNYNYSTVLKAKRFVLQDNRIGTDKPEHFFSKGGWEYYCAFHAHSVENDRLYESLKKLKMEVALLKKELVNLKKLKDDKKVKKAEKKLEATEAEEKEQEKSIDLNLKNLGKVLGKLFREYLKDNSIVSLREYLYHEGIDVFDGERVRHYKMYKRSASKAKAGRCLFIWDKIYDDMMEWTWMGLRFDKGANYDLTSLKAYESLVASGIQDVVHIDPESILILDSVESPDISGNRLIYTAVENDENGTTETKNKLVSEEEYKSIKGREFVTGNKIWDGQALLDESIFEDAGFKGKNRHGMMLLRNHFFKACAFNTRISEYYQKNNITHVVDMFGRKIPAGKIKMIVTIDSIKFVDKFFDTKFENHTFSGSSDLEKQMAAYDYWKSHISSEFGIVKTEHASYMGKGKYHRASYQIINTLPLGKEDIRELLADEIRYIKLLKEDEAVFLHHILSTRNSLRSTYYIYNFYKYFKDFEFTDDFKKYRNEQIQKYRTPLMKKGKVAIQGDFYVLCSMPMEMLEYSVHHDRDKIKPYIGGKGHVHIKGLEDNADVTLFRYPHISSGAVCALKNSNNKKTESIDKWFNFDNADGCNIVVLSPWNSNIMVRLGGADFDSDTALFIKNDVIRKAAIKLLKIKALNPARGELPVVEIDEELKGETQQHEISAKNLARLDENLAHSQKRIGELSNSAQLFNSYLWSGFFNKKSDDYIKQVYDCVLLLAALTELEIDSSKHNTSCDIDALKDEVIHAQYNGEEILKTTVVKEKAGGEEKVKITRAKPAFMQEQRAKKESYWDCPMDYIGIVLAEEFSRKGETKTYRLSFDEFIRPLIPEIIDMQEEVQEDEKSASKKNEYVKNEICKRFLALQEQQILNNKSTDNNEEESVDVEDDFKALVEQIKKKKLDEDTVIRLFRADKEVYNSYSSGHKKGEYKYPELIYDDTFRQNYLGLIVSSGSNAISVLKPNTCRKELTHSKKEANVGGEIELWGEKYYYHCDINYEDYEKIIVKREKK
ncbi:hypothetical protein [Butyrivibrio sp. WCD2001]|uniref:hypothetical protein n=1 Tax=Butyrivibrio sp. WCD2001 TaxID=1280681 RepID=UPI00041AE96A|nr:hypothetical protein [Butyrivibrio sp. WCD2001]